MKKYFYIGVVVIICFAIAIVCYGAWLNYSDAKQIAKRMEERTITVLCGEAKRRDILPKVILGSVRFSSDNITDAVALTDGRIKHWFVEKNSAVRKGEVLLTMVNEQIPLKIQQATSTVSQEEALLSRALSMYRRQARLLERNATSKDKYEEAEANYFAAQEKLKVSKAQLAQYQIQSDWLSVTSPIDGEVLVIYQHEGASIQAGVPVALVGDFTRLKFSIDVEDLYAQKVRLGESFTLTFNENVTSNKAYNTKYGVGNKGDHQKVIAKIIGISPDLSEPADMRQVVFEVDNRAHILEPMTYTEVTMELQKRENLLAVPISALTDTAMDKVFIVDENDIIHRRSVKLGVSDGEYVEIVSGINEGERVALGNFDGLEEGLRVNTRQNGDD